MPKATVSALLSRTGRFLGWCVRLAPTTRARGSSLCHPARTRLSTFLGRTSASGLAPTSGGPKKQAGHQGTLRGCLRSEMGVTDGSLIQTTMTLERGTFGNGSKSMIGVWKRLGMMLRNTICVLSVTVVLLGCGATRNQLPPLSSESRDCRIGVERARNAALHECGSDPICYAQVEGRYDKLLADCVR